MAGGADSARQNAQNNIKALAALASGNAKVTTKTSDRGFTSTFVNGIPYIGPSLPVGTKPTANNLAIAAGLVKPPLPSGGMEKASQGGLLTQPEFDALKAGKLYSLNQVTSGTRDRSNAKGAVLSSSYVPYSPPVPSALSSSNNVNDYNNALIASVNSQNGGFMDKLGGLAQTLAPTAMNFLVPGVGEAIGAGMGLQGAAAQYAGNAAVAGGVAGVSGGDPLKAAGMSLIGTGIQQSGLLDKITGSTPAAPMTDPNNLLGTGNAMNQLQNGPLGLTDTGYNAGMGATGLSVASGGLNGNVNVPGVSSGSLTSQITDPSIAAKLSQAGVTDAALTQAATNPSLLQQIATSTGIPSNVLTSALSAIPAISSLISAATGPSGAQVSASADPYAATRAAMQGNLASFMANPSSNAGFAATYNPTTAATVGQTASANYTPGALVGGLDQGNFIGKLSALMSNPSSITSTPGYAFLQQQGQQAVERALAARGQVASGQEMLSLQAQDQALANQQYTQQINQLSPLAQAQGQEATQVWQGTTSSLTSQANQNAQIAAARASQQATLDQQTAQYNQTLKANQYNQQLQTLGNLAGGSSSNPVGAAQLGVNATNATNTAIGQGIGALATTVLGSRPTQPTTGTTAI